ncbi:MAG: agmatine deiminase family protein [candidate division Zixibacteria bacterium]|nr:agmatine deiminase family protein [candidate division Zixibacteria bacterium]
MNMSERFKYLLSLTVIAVLLIASPVIAIEENLPIELTPEEMERLDEIGINHIQTTPPSGQIRNIAEWEPSQGVIIRWPLGIPLSLVAELSEDLMVTTLVANTSSQNSAISSYTSASVTMANTDFLIASTNSIWTRDYGPWFIFEGNDSLAIVDHIYNRPRPLDDQIPWTLGTQWNLDVYGMNLEHAGGNHMSDGLGRSMSTVLTYNENSSMSEHTIDSIMMAYLGNDYTVLDYIESGGIHHIDCWAKFLNPGTIMVKDVPASSSSHNLLNARAAYLSQQISSWGQPYNVVRIYCPYGTAYTNSIILNDKVFVPTFSNSMDDSAMQTYHNAMPGYEILGFDGSWLDDDAIHCRTMGVPDRNMLDILHTPLTTTGDTINGYHVKVQIKAHSGASFITDSLKVFYLDSSMMYKTVLLTATMQPDSFLATIPAQSAGTEISYYIKAGDASGKVETHPYIGQSWAHKFYINHAPGITSPDYYECLTNEEFAYFPEFNDPDDTELTIAYSDFPAWLSVVNDSLIGVAPALAEDAHFTVSVSDPYSQADQAVSLSVLQGYLCGDANGDTEVNVADAVFIINFAFKGGPAPDPLDSGDVNSDGSTNIGDAVYLINYVFKGGPAPDCQ